MEQAVTLGIAFIAGFISFFSPCTLPLLPAYICYLSGVKLTNLKTGRTRIFVNSVFFILGFAVIFTLLGAAAGLLGSFFPITKIWLRRSGGVLVILFGLYMMHIIKLPFLDNQKNLIPHFHKYSFLTSFIFGATFAIGWIPCTSPVISSIMILAMTGGSLNSGTMLLAAYTFGLAVPFLMLGLFIKYFLGYVSHKHKYFKYYYLVSGLFLVIIGLMLIFNQIEAIFTLFSR